MKTLNKMRIIRVVIIGALLGFAISAAAQSPVCNCCSEDHKAFDFWIGNWEVTNTQGAVVGNNTITQIEGGCALRENWISAGGKVTGTSLNFYNATTKKWEQLWVDNSGTNLKLIGNRTENQMILSSEPYINASGNAVVNRITWTLNNDKSVRQLWEILQDGKVVNTAFDGLYRKIN